MSEDQAREYPPRLYQEGDSNLEGKGINHNIKLGEFPAIRESIGEEIWAELKETELGLIAKLVDSHFLWSGKTVHYLLCRQLRILKKELWCIVAGKPIRFGLNEFHHITGLNIDDLPTEKFEPEADYKAFFSELRVPTGEGPNLDELRQGLVTCRAWPTEKRRWIPFESAKRVFDDEAMKTYPWGRAAYEALVVSIKLLRPIGKTYTVSGLVFVLQAWAYESIITIAERFGNAVNADEIPLLRWGGSRTRSTIESVIAEDIKANGGELRVRTMVEKAELSELFHFWPDQLEDPALDNLIQDLHEVKLVKGYWDVKTSEKKKKLLKDKEAEKKKEKKKKKEVAVESDEDEDVRSREQDGQGDQQSLVDVVSNLISPLNSRFDTVDTSIKEMSSRLDVIGCQIESSVEAKFEGRFGSIENDVKQIKEQLKAIADSKSSSYIRDMFLSKPQPQTQEDNRKAQTQKTPDVPKKITNNQSAAPSPPPSKQADVGVSRKLEAEFDKVSIVSDVDFVETVSPLNRRLRSRKPPSPNVPKHKKEKTLNELIQKPPTRRGRGRKPLEQPKKVPPTALKIRINKPKPSEETKSKAEEAKEKAELDSDVVDVTDKLAPDGSSLINPEDMPTHTFPVIGDNGLSCMRKGCLPSRAIYDPLAPVDPAKLEKLKAYLTGPESKQYYETYGFDDVMFYSVIMAERKDWPDEKHGWLYDDHIAAYVKLLTTRLLRDPTPYYSERVMILDPWFTSMWTKDYAQWKMNPKRVSFKGSTYEKWVNGTGGDDPTNKKWITDVDHLYTILQTGGNHWVAIHVDLPRGHVDCYDCIVGCHTPESDGKIQEYCRPFTRMIPQIMSEIIPPAIRVPQYDQFSFRRRDLKKVPQNTITGDCGVYTLQILECLLLGVSFEGINNSNIQGLRVRMATELYDELPNRMPVRFYET
uniref:Uncharacterized protein At2g24930 n=1 Tax=Arabidopsis thaliana TaxID=3702 RepID=Q9SK40_ARATH|nr:hypothetical protein [Arabidopsis thaliana]